MYTFLKKYVDFFYYNKNIQIIFGQRDTEDEWFKSFDNQLQTNSHPLVNLIIMFSPRLWLMGLYGLKIGFN